MQPYCFSDFVYKNMKKFTKDYSYSQLMNIKEINILILKNYKAEYEKKGNYSKANLMKNKEYETARGILKAVNEELKLRNKNNFCIQNINNNRSIQYEFNA